MLSDVDVPPNVDTESPIPRPAALEWKYAMESCGVCIDAEIRNAVMERYRRAALGDVMPNRVDMQ